MANIVLEGNNTIASNKLHFYVRPTGTALADYKDATVTSAIGNASASYFANVETGFTLNEEAGNSIVTTTGREIVLDKNVAIEFMFLGGTAVDYNALMSGANKYLQQSLDVILVKAPQSRTKQTVEIGDEVYVIYNAICDIRLAVADGAPTKIILAFKQNAASTDTVINWGKVVADT